MHGRGIERRDVDSRIEKSGVSAGEKIGYDEKIVTNQNIRSVF